jgi:predicted acyl esterase
MARPSRRELTRILRAVVLMLVLAWAPAPPASAHSVPAGSRWHEASIRSPDGTRLHLDVFRPARGGRTPAIVIPSRYFATGSDPAERPKMLDYYDDLHARAYRRGYSVIQLTPRGYGKSEGCTDWRGPGERADVIAAIRWAATRRWSTGKVGTYGLSYDAALIFAALSNRVPGHAAAVPIAGNTSAYRGFYMRRVRYQPFAVLQPPDTLLYVFPPPEPAGVDAALLAAEASMRNPGCPVEHLSWLNPDPAAPYWRTRDYEDRVAPTRVPILWSQGTLDWGVHADGLAALWPRLRGAKRLWLGQYPHLVPSEWERGHPETVGRRGWTDEVFRFLDRHLKGKRPPADPPVVVQGTFGRWRAEPSWPPRDARRSTMRILPGSYTDGPGNKGEAYCTRVEAHCVPGDAGNGSWTLSRPLPHDAHISGVPRLRVKLGATALGANVVALLYDVDREGRAALVTRGAALATGTGPVDVELYLQDARLRRGHRLGLLLAGSDDWWFEPGHTGAQVQVTGGSLTVPFLRYRRLHFLRGGPSQALRQRTTFRIPAPTLGARTVYAKPPPRLRQAPPLRLSVRPRVVPAGERAVLRVRVRFYGSVLHGVLVRTAGVRAHTDARGRAQLAVAPRHAGRLRVRAAVPGLPAATARVLVQAASR